MPWRCSVKGKRWAMRNSHAPDSAQPGDGTSSFGVDAGALAVAEGNARFVAELGRAQPTASAHANASRVLQRPITAQAVGLVNTIGFL